MKKKIKMIILIIILLLLAGFVYYKFINTESDAAKFKKEYEALNGEETESGNTYQKLKISSNNPVKYSDYDEVIDVIKNKTGIIYLGFPECPWCRTALPVLLKAAQKNNVETIYYINILNDRDSYTVENNKLVYAKDEDGNEIKGTKGYFKLLKALDSVLDEYVIISDGKEYDTKEKRIYAPTMIFVKEGKILGIHVSTIESQSSGFNELTDEEYNELYDIYDGYIKSMNTETCKVGSSC